MKGNIMAQYEDDDKPQTVCSGCKATADYCRPLTEHRWARSDAYGIYTGIYCRKCYGSDKYPYRKDDYHDPAYAGERLDEDY